MMELIGIENGLSFYRRNLKRIVEFSLLNCDSSRKII